MLRETNVQFAMGNFDVEQGVVLNFLKDFGKNIYACGDSYKAPDKSLMDIADMIYHYIRKELKQDVAVTALSNELFIVSNVENLVSPLDPILVTMTRGAGRSSRKSKVLCRIEAYAPKSILQKIMDFLDTTFSYRSASVDWWFIGKNGPDSISVNLDSNPYKIKDEFYPWLKEGPYEYFERFLESQAPILFIAGDPGTGKTSFLREMIVHYQLAAHIGYDTRLLESDGMFMEFISSEKKGVMILEDAETIVLPRKENKQSLMNRMLNVSEGLIKFPHKKFIFTTNDNDFTKVDAALIRPGRCFDSTRFRRLTQDETDRACDAVGISRLDGQNDYSLAEIFNRDYRPEIRKIGF